MLNQAVNNAPILTHVVRDAMLVYMNDGGT